SYADALSMKQLKIHQFLHCVSHRMSQIQKSALSLLSRIAFYNTGFNLAASADHGSQKISVMVPDSFLVPAYRTEKFTVAYKTCLQHFSHAAVKFLHRQASQCLHIHVYKAGLMKSAHHILVLAEINARFSSHATVHLGKQCRRNLYKVDPPEI